MVKQVFISHSSYDKALADQLVAGLETRGILCWVAPRDIPLGASYGPAILDGIHAAETFLVLLSKESAASEQVERELERATTYKKKIVGLRVDSTEPGQHLEYYIAGRQWMDLGVLNEARLDELASHFGQTAAPRPPGKQVPGPRAAKPTQTNWKLYVGVGALVALIAVLGIRRLGSGEFSERQPLIAEFLASPDRIAPGERVRLNWKVQNAETVLIAPLDAGPFQPEGYTDDHPDSTRTYVLTARNSRGLQATGRLIVQVGAAARAH